MSHAHPQKEKNRKVKQELEELQESRKAAEEVKLDLLEHNQLIKLHESESQPQPAEDMQEKPAPQAPRQDYIKRPEDLERIARNTLTGNAPAEAASVMESPARQLFALQLQTINALMQAWTGAMQTVFAVPENRENG